MRIIISPAKKMNVDTDSLPWRDLPVFLAKTEELAKNLQGMGYDALKRLWKCNDSIAAVNVDRLAHMDLHTRLTPALLAYEGMQYRYMAPSVFTDSEFDYVQKYLRILSGFYGVLKPFDGVTSYRLEMQAKLNIREAKGLYNYWSDRLAENLFSETDCIVNLAPKEYSICISKYLSDSVRFITCVFGEETGGKVIEKGTMCKMARGEMVRYMAENQITKPEDIKSFARLNYRFDPTRSDDTQFVFVRKATEISQY